MEKYTEADYPKGVFGILSMQIKVSQFSKFKLKGDERKMCIARYTVVLAEEYEYRKAECEETHRAVHGLKYGDSRTGFFCRRFLESRAALTEIEEVLRIIGISSSYPERELDSGVISELKSEYDSIRDRAESLKSGLASSSERGRRFLHRQYAEACARVMEFETVMLLAGTYEPACKK